MSLASKNPESLEDPVLSSDAEKIRTFPLKQPIAKAARPPAGGALAHIEGYEILHELGRGGMAIVFKARQLALNRIVALKMVLGGEYREPEFHRRFQVEAEAVARLQHPNIIQIFDYSTMSAMFPGETHCPYIAFEYVAGGSLSSRVRGLPQPPLEAAHIVETLADAVQYAHGCGIIHRDLKPANVLLTADGTPKISDFGLAKLLDDAEPPAGLTAAGSILGTPEYMAPEQTIPHSRLGPAVDVYALGVILYELLTGRRPFQGGSVLETVRDVCASEPAPPRNIRRNIPRDLETICLKCLRKEPHQRYPSALALADDLRRLRKGEPIDARPVGALERAWKWVRRYRSLTTLLAFILAVTFFGLPGTTYLWITATKAKEQAVLEAQTARKATRLAKQNMHAAIKAGNEAARLRRDSERREARLALDQGLAQCQQGQLERGLLWLARSLELHEPFKDAAVERALRINLADWMEQTARPVIRFEHFPGRVNAGIFLPDSAAMVATDYFARRYDIGAGKPNSEPVGGPIINSVADAFTQVMSLALTPDQQLVAMGRSSGAVHFWDIATQTQVGPVLLHKRNVWSLACCPKSERLAAAHDDDVILWHRGTGEKLRTLPHPANVGQVAFDPEGKLLVTAAWDGTLRVFEAATGVLLRELRVQKDRLGALAISADGRYLVVGGRVGRTQLYVFPDLVEAAPPLRHVAAITAAAFSPDGRIIVTGGRDETARVWETTTGRLLATMRFPAEVNSVAIAADGRSCLVGVSDGCAHIWELPRGKQLGLPLNHRFAVDSLHFAPDGQSIIAGCSNAAYVWGVPGGPQRQLLGARRIRLHDVAMSPDGSHVILSHWNNGLCCWKAGDTGLVESVEVSLPAPADRLAAGNSGLVWWTNAGKRQLVRCVHIATGKEARPQLVHPSAILCLTVSPGENQVATGSDDLLLRLWDVESGVLTRTLPHPERVTAITFDGTGTRLASGCRDGSVRVWEATTGRLLTATAPQQCPVLSVAFSPNGQLLASGDDRAAYFWDVASGVMLGAPLWHNDAVQAVAFQPGGNHLATGCRDGSVRTWSLPAAPHAGATGQLRAAVERLTRLRLLADGSFQPLQ